MFKLDLEKAENQPRDQITDIRWIILKARKFQKNIFFFIDYAMPKPWLCESQETVENSEIDGNIRPPYLPPEKSVCWSRNNT